MSFPFSLALETSFVLFMTYPVLQIGDRTINATEVFSLVVQYQMLPQFCREIIIDDAISEIECSEEEVEQARQQFYTMHQIIGETERQTWLNHTGLTAAQLDKLCTRKLRLEKFKQLTWGNKLEAQFLASKAQLDRVVYSLIRHSDLGIMQELFFRIKAGETSLDDIARQYSQGPEAETGGMLGPVPLSQPHPVLANLLNNSQPGQLLPPTRLGDWYVIVRLEKRLPAQFDDATRQKLLDSLFNAWVQEQSSQIQVLPLQSATPSLALL